MTEDQGREPRLRLFLAVDLPPLQREGLAALRTGVAGARWVHADQLHLTLRFLGDTPASRVEALRAALAAVRLPPFSVEVAGVGVFPPRPSRRNPVRVLWAGLVPAEPLAALKAAIDDALGPDPEAAGRPFSPHITLARFKAPPGADLEAYRAEHAGFRTAAWQVDAFTLYASTLDPDRARHDPLERYPLLVP